MKRSLAIVALFASGLLLARPAPLSAEPNDDIDLKLFETPDIDRSTGCSVALWQDDRDPAKDKFAYLFAETLTGSSFARQPARIKIGKEAVALTRVATGGKTTGFDLYEYQLYKLPAENEFVVMNLKLADKKGESVDIVSGVMILIMKGKPVFRATVKGNAGCAAPPSTSVPARVEPKTAAPAPAQAAAPAGATKPAASRPQTAVGACQAAAEAASEPTGFACNWKKAIAESPGFSLTGKYKYLEKGASGEMTIIETGLEPAQIGILTVTKSSNSPTCSAGLGASRDDQDRLTATMDEPKDCVVRIVSVPGPNIVKVTATEACSAFCGMGGSFDGKWQLEK